MIPYVYAEVEVAGRREPVALRLRDDATLAEVIWAENIQYGKDGRVVERVIDWLEAPMPDEAEFLAGSGEAEDLMASGQAPAPAQEAPMA